MQRAVILIYVGSALAIVNGVVSGLTMQHIPIPTYSSPNTGTMTTTQFFAFTGFVGGILQSGIWLWMAWKTGAGRNWARILSSVFFGISCLGVLIGLSRIGVETITSLAEWGVGLAAIIYLWKRESSDFFEFIRQAQYAAAYGRAYGGYQPYGQAPYGQAPYGQAPYGQPADGQPAPLSPDS